MDLETKSMAGAVKKTDVLALAHFGWKTALGEEFLDCLVNRHSIHSRLDFFQCKRLPGLYRLPKLALWLAGAAAQNRTGHVAEVAGPGVARENIQNDQ